MEHTFTWASSLPTKVIVTGSFDDWKSTLHLEKQESGKFSGKITLPWGTKVVYKYLVDDEWQVNTQEQTEPDESGNLNNVLNVPTEAQAEKKEVQGEAKEEQVDKEKEEIPDVVGGITAGVAGLATAAAFSATNAASSASEAISHAIHSDEPAKELETDVTKQGLTAAPVNHTENTQAPEAVVPGEAPADPAPSRSPGADPSQQYISTVPSDDKIAAAAQDGPSVPTDQEIAKDLPSKSLDTEQPVPPTSTSESAAPAAAVAAPALGQAILPSSEEHAQPATTAATSSPKKFVPPSSVVEDEETAPTLASIVYDKPKRASTETAGPSKTVPVNSSANGGPSELAEHTGAIAERRDDQVTGDVAGPIQSDPAPSTSESKREAAKAAVVSDPTLEPAAQQAEKAPPAASAETKTDEAKKAVASDPTLEPAAQKSGEKPAAPAATATKTADSSSASSANNAASTPQKKRVQMQEPSSTNSTPGQFSTAPSSPQGTPTKGPGKRKSGLFAKIKTALSPHKSSSS